MTNAAAPYAFAFWLLRCFARLVPSAERENWRAEWNGELAYVMGRHRGGPALLFALGSLQDAAWFGWNGVQAATLKWLKLQSSSWAICLGRLLVFLAFASLCSHVEAGFAHAPFADLYDVHVDDSLPNVLLQLFMAFAALPAITSLHPGPHPTRPFIADRTVTVRFWSFLVLKALLVVQTCHFAGLIATHLAESAAILSHSFEGYRAIRDGLTPLQFLATFASCLYGLRWVLQDQRRRCPMCLRCLSSLEPQGQRARILLGGSRVVMVCLNGHGSLIVPDLETSWLPAQHWEIPDGF